MVEEDGIGSDYAGFSQPSVLGHLPLRESHCYMVSTEDCVLKIGDGDKGIVSHLLTPSQAFYGTKVFNCYCVWLSIIDWLLN